MPAAREFAQFGIRVMCIAPGIFYTPMLMAIPEESRQSLAASVPFPKALGMKKLDYLRTYGFTGHPLVKTHCRFLAPTRFGDEVAIATTVTAIRRSSFDVRHRLMLDETLAVEGFETRVWVEGDPTAGNMKAVPLPADLVARLSHD